MHKVFLVAALSVCSLALPEPMPQQIDIDAVKAAPKPRASMILGLSRQIVKYDRAAMLADARSILPADHVPLPEVSQDKHIGKRSPCQLEPPAATGAPAISGGLTTPDAFKAEQAFKILALNVVTPPGYTEVFAGLTGAVNSYGYLGYQLYQKYDVVGCAAWCSKTTGCQSFNIYFERSPSVEPGAGCSNPSPVTLIKCVLWGGPSTIQNAVNFGQFRADFQDLIAGSNAYTKSTVSQPAGYGPPVALGNSAIDSVYDSQGYQDYMGVKIFSYGPFDPQLCADYCTAQSNFNRANPPSNGAPVQTCQFFNTYLIYLNAASNYQAQYCAIYSESFDASYATNKGYSDGTNQYSIESSYAFSNSSNPGSPNKDGAIYQAVAQITASSLQGFCSTLLGYLPSTTTTTATITVTPTTTVDTTVTQSTTTTAGAGGAGGAGQGQGGPGGPGGPGPGGPGRPPKRAVAAAAVQALSTPGGLARFPATVVSSACSKQATSPTTSITTVSITTFGPTKTVSVTRSTLVTVTVTR